MLKSLKETLTAPGLYELHTWISSLGPPDGSAHLKSAWGPWMIELSSPALYILCRLMSFSGLLRNCQGLVLKTLLLVFIAGTRTDIYQVYHNLMNGKHPHRIKNLVGKTLYCVNVHV